MEVAPQNQSGCRHVSIMTSHTTSMLDQDLHDVSSAISEKRRPKHILDLPVEILNAILKEARRLECDGAANQLTCRDSSITQMT